MTASPDQNKTTHFGYQTVPQDAKSGLVAEVFHSVAPKYDLMNDLMSMGLHRVWKQFAISQAAVRSGQTILDVAAGTGDFSKAFAKLTGPTGRVIMTDINESMLTAGRNRLTDAGILGNIEYIQADAECLPFKDNYFDCITMGFGLRNVTDKSAALRSLYRVLKPGGKCLILEFSHPPSPVFKKIYDLYSFHLIPKIGEWVAKDRDSYQYLVESIRMHPDQETLTGMMKDAGFDEAAFFNLSGGIVALHKGIKY